MVQKSAKFNEIEYEKPGQSNKTPRNFINCHGFSYLMVMVYVIRIDLKTTKKTGTILTKHQIL